jgi:hypothetical protein
MSSPHTATSAPSLFAFSPPVLSLHKPLHRLAGPPAVVAIKKKPKRGGRAGKAGKRDIAQDYREYVRLARPVYSGSKKAATALRAALNTNTNVSGGRCGVCEGGSE